MEPDPEDTPSYHDGNDRSQFAAKPSAVFARKSGADAGSQGGDDPVGAEPPSPDPTAIPEPRISVPPFPSPQTVTMPTPPDHPAHAGVVFAQLTFGFEITSLRLTPFFRLGAVQLKALSNVVSLGLVNARQSDQPLAAGVSFQIERVDLDVASRLKSIRLKPLDEARTAISPVSKLHVDAVAITGETEGAPITVTTSSVASTAVQLVGTFAITAMEFSPAFEIDSLRLELASEDVRLRVAPASGPGAQEMPPSFEIAEVQLDEARQIRGARLVPSLLTNG